MTRRASPVLRLLTPPKLPGEPAASTTARESSPKRPSIDDLEMLESIKRGETSAAAALHDRVRPQIDRTLARLLGRHDPEHEELAQIALTELVLTIDRFRGECSLDHWTARITAHTVYNEVRRRTRARRVFAFHVDVDVDVEQRAGGVDTEREVIARDVVRRVRACLDALEPNKAWTLVLHDVCGHDLHEIAEITAVSTSAAQSRLVRARRELRASLLEDPELAELVAPPGRGS